jgi:esterase/lipase
MIRRLLLALGATVALTAVLYLMGPVHALDTRDTPLNLPRETDALDRWLEESEQRYGDVVEGTEKRIRWAHDDRRRTPLSIIYLHGYTATRQEVDPLCDELAEALGANVFYTRLTGHGRPARAMGEVRGSDWLRDAREALEIGRRIGERVIVVGTSTGGTLALWLAQRDDASPIAAQILISPNLGPRARSGELLAGPWGAQLLQLLVGDEYRWTPRNEDQAKYWTWKYPAQALLPMMAIVRDVRDSPLENIRQPTLVIYSPNDQVVSPDEILKAHERLGASIKPIIAVETSGDLSNHVLAGRILAPNDTPRVLNSMVKFTREIGLTADSTIDTSPATKGRP